MSDREHTRRKHGGHPNWKPGESGNPKGRPKGARKRLGEDFLNALHEDFLAHGLVAIERTREEKPGAYLKVIASVLPKQLEIQESPFEDVSDDELTMSIASLRAALAAADVSEERETQDEREDEPDRLH